MGNPIPRDHIIRTPTGFYVPAHVADRLPPPYRAPDGLHDPLLSLMSVPIFILPAPAPVPARPARWWIRAWHRLTRRGTR